MFQTLWDVGANILAGLVSDKGGDVFGVIVLVVIGVIALIRWHRAQRAANKPGMTSLFFIIAAFSIALVAASFGAYGLGTRGAKSSDGLESQAILQWPNPYHPIQIINKTFENQEVVLDGYEYIKCTFRNVTFIYNGTTAIQFNNNSVYGPSKYRTDSPAVGGAIGWMKGFGWMKDGTEVTFEGKNNILSTPSFTPNAQQ